MDALQQMKARVPDAAEGGDALLLAYLEDAGAYILHLTGRGAVPGGLVPVQVQLAVILYNRRGIEGEQVRSVGGVSRTLFGDRDVPDSLRAQVLAHRLARVAGRTI